MAAARAFERYIRGELTKLDRARQKRYEHAADVRDRAGRDPGRWGRLSTILSDDGETYQREENERDKLQKLESLVPLVRSGAMTVAEAMQSVGKADREPIRQSSRREQSKLDHLAETVDAALNRLNDERELLHDCVGDLRQALRGVRGSCDHDLESLVEEVRLAIENENDPLPDDELRDQVGVQVERLQQALRPTRKLRYGARRAQ